MRNYITAETEKNQEAIKLHVTQTASEAERSLKSHIGIAIRDVTRHGQDSQMQVQRDRLIGSLKFDRMNERRSEVTPSHPNTFTWMLQDGSDVERSQRSSESFDNEHGSISEDRTDDWELSNATDSWDSFSDWLRSTHSVYWISGKPGSGKTTLMKYLLGQPQTQKYLNQWKPNAIIISHFLWRPGTVMQQSIKGLMSSLLHQLLIEEPGVVDDILYSTKDMPLKESETDWSSEELQKALHYVISVYPRPIAIFLDGLDEVLPRDGVLRLLDIVDQLSQPCGHTGNTKLCLGSRRETLLYKRLCGYPQIRLEQLNLVDLRRYGKDNVIIPSDYHINIPYKDGMYYPVLTCRRETPPSRDEFREWLVCTLVDKADGVFLWLCLTVKTLTEALNNDEIFENLEARIQSLPSDLADLYADMWNRMNDDGSHLRVRAASYLQLALDCTDTNSVSVYPLNLFIMMVATTPEKAEVFLQPDAYKRTTVTSLMEACEKTRRDTINRCAGLLVCPSPQDVDRDSVVEEFLYPWYGKEYDKLIPYVSDYPTYSFLHRTARDFLTDTEAGKGILSLGKFPGSLSRLKLLEARLAICQLFRKSILCVSDSPTIESSHLPNGMTDIFNRFLNSNKIEEDVSTRQQISRLLLQCEKLFNNGQLFGPTPVPPNAMQFEKEPLRPRHHTSYDTTVRNQHDFLIEAAFYGRDYSGTWSHLLPVIMNRHLDKNTKCRLLIHACAFGGLPGDPFLRIDCRLKAIKSLLSWGASPYQQTVNRKHEQWWPGPDIVTTETPFKTLMTSIWMCAAVSGWGIDDNLCRKLFELISLFVAHGADAHEEIHVVIQVKEGSVEFADLWAGIYQLGTEERPEDSPTDSSHILAILAYPASALLAYILQVWNLADYYQMDWVPEMCELPESGIEKGRLICIIEMRDIVLTLKRETESYTPQPFLSTEIFNLQPGDGMEKPFLGLIRLVEDSLQGFVQKEDSGLSLSHVSVPLEIQTEMATGLQRLRTTNLPVKERCKELRTRLGVITPLEEPEWQINTDVLPSQLVSSTPPSDDGSTEEGLAEL